MKYNSMNIYKSGYKTSAEAEADLEEIVTWFNGIDRFKNFTVSTSIRNGPYGFKFEFNAEKTGNAVG